MIINLLKETLEDFKEQGLTEKDILWVGTREGYCTWDEFKTVAIDIDYDNGYGSVKISEKLIIITKRGWFERAEYDGEEWWVYHTRPKKPKHHSIPTRRLIY